MITSIHIRNQHTQDHYTKGQPENVPFSFKKCNAILVAYVFSVVILIPLILLSPPTGCCKCLKQMNDDSTNT